VKYRLDLVALKLLVRDGAMWRLSWVAPPSPEGHDGARVVFEMPAAPTEPRLASPEQAATTLATLRREPDKDELELVRAHVPRGEAVTWSARVDPKAFPRVVSPELRPASAAIIAAVPVPNHVPLVLLASGLAVLAGALALALRAKQGMVARGCEARSVRARVLVPFAGGSARLRTARRRPVPLRSCSGDARVRRGARGPRDGGRRASFAHRDRATAWSRSLAARPGRRGARGASARAGVR